MTFEQGGELYRMKNREDDGGDGMNERRALGRCWDDVLMLFDGMGCYPRDGVGCFVDGMEGSPWMVWGSPWWVWVI